MKLLHHVIWLIVITILQVTLVNAIAIFGVRPNLFLIYIVLVGFLCGRMRGMAWGMVFGLACDIVIGRLIGTNMIIFMFLGYISAKFSDNFYVMPNLLVFAIMVVVATIVSGTIYLLPYSIEFNGVKISSEIFRTVLPESIYNGVIAIIILPILKMTLTKFREIKI